MANNTPRWIANLNGAAEPLRVLGKFQAGSTQAVKVGELIELTGVTNTCWVPMDSDFAGAGNVAIADEEIVAGDLGGYFPVIVPRTGDVFEYDLASAGSSAVGTAVYWSSSEAVAITGSNQLGTIVGTEHYPLQGHKGLQGAGAPDAGTTLRSRSSVLITIKAAASYYAALQA
jgi:hypothetical protein